MNNKHLIFIIHLLQMSDIISQISKSIGMSETILKNKILCINRQKLQPVDASTMYNLLFNLIYNRKVAYQWLLTHTVKPNGRFYKCLESIENILILTGLNNFLTIYHNLSFNESCELLLKVVDYRDKGYNTQRTFIRFFDLNFKDVNPILTDHQWLLEYKRGLDQIMMTSK
jgi:hypothetical protein